MAKEPVESLEQLLALPKAVQELPLFKSMLELAKLEDNPRFLVIVAHGLVELMVNTLIEHKCKNRKRIIDQHRDFTHSIKLVLLHEMNVLSDYRFACLDWFRKVRNDCVHEAKFNPNLKQLVNELKKATNGIDADIKLKQGSLFHLCLTMALSVLKGHTDLLIPILANVHGLSKQERMLTVKRHLTSVIIAGAGVTPKPTKNPLGPSKR